MPIEGFCQWGPTSPRSAQVRLSRRPWLDRRDPYNEDRSCHAELGGVDATDWAGCEVLDGMDCKGVDDAEESHRKQASCANWP